MINVEIEAEKSPQAQADGQSLNLKFEKQKRPGRGVFIEPDGDERFRVLRMVKKYNKKPASCWFFCAQGSAAEKISAWYFLK
ncbi:MAG: hypothetical protein Q4A28_05030 [Brachymonas sp.]|nr:hypothetical protein [Brachymonas sp.]